MKKIFFLLFCSVSLYSCKKDLTFENKKYIKKSELNCTENCPEINITVPVASNLPIVADSINKKLLSIITDIVYLDEKTLENPTYQLLADNFIQSYENLKKEFPSDSFGWEADIKARVIYQSDKLINLELNYYSFTGGAHGYQGLTSLVFDLKTGKYLTLENLIKDESQFHQFVENKFREKYRILPNENINSTGLMFENDTFALPQNVFFQEKGILLYYNTYEVAAYVDGPKEVFIPFSEADPFLSIK